MHRPRNLEASPFYRLVRDHFDEFERVYAERFQPKYGYWRPVIRNVIEKYTSHKTNPNITLMEFIFSCILCVQRFADGEGRLTIE